MFLITCTYDVTEYELSSRKQQSDITIHFRVTVHATVAEFSYDYLRPPLQTPGIYRISALADILYANHGRKPRIISGKETREPHYKHQSYASRLWLL